MIDVKPFLTAFDNLHHHPMEDEFAIQASDTGLGKEDISSTATSLCTRWIEG